MTKLVRYVWLLASMMVLLIVPDVGYAQTSAAFDNTIRAAAEQALAARPADLFPGNALLSSDIKRTDDWALLTAALFDGPVLADEPTGGMFILAERKGKTWIAAVQGSEQFRRWLPKVPITLLDDTAKSYLLWDPAQVGGPGVQIVGPDIFSLPYATGESWLFSGGPHGNPRSAIDFARNSGLVRAAADGVVSRPCANLVIVTHIDGWQTGYYHLRDIAVGNGQRVSRGTLLGYASRGVDCGGSATGDHVHLSLRRNGSQLAIHGAVFGGWAVEQGAAEYQGCMVKGSQRICQGGYIYNDGTIGSNTMTPGQNIVQNATFDQGTTSWWLWGNGSWAVYNGILHFKHEYGGNGAAVVQDFNYFANASTPFEIRLDLGNTSPVAKLLTVYLRGSANWEGAFGCQFSIPPYTPLRTYAVRGRTGIAWNGFKLDVKPNPPDGIPDVQMDNVSVAYRPDLSLSQTECSTPIIPNVNLVYNGKFDQGTTNWWLWGNGSWAVYNEILHFKHENGGGGAAVGQDFQYSVNAGTTFEIRLDLGNNSPVTKLSAVYLRGSANWEGAFGCQFSIPPYTPLRTYIVRGRTSIAWNGFKLDVKPNPPDGIPDVQMDNVSIVHWPDLHVQETTCVSTP